MTDRRFNYQRYLASREWAILKRAVQARSCGRCERCLLGRYEATHHLTYERIGHEELGDLLGVCRECHGWLSATSEYDPVLGLIVLSYRDWKEAQERGHSPFALMQALLQLEDEAAVAVADRLCILVIGRYCMETLFREGRMPRPATWEPNGWTMAEYVWFVAPEAA